MKWISVKDRLPPEDKRVLVFKINYLDDIDIGYFDPSTETKTGWRCKEYMDIEVDFWMPLPEPPNERT